MRLMFVNWAFENHGSAQDLYNYARVAQVLGHEVALYGPQRAGSAFNYSLDVGAADAVVFIFEFTTHLEYGEKFGLLRVVGRVPRRRRVVIDCDGGYNDAICVLGDINHPDAAASKHWMEVCGSLSDKIFQPTFHPLLPNVRPFFFHAYSPAWERPMDFGAKEYGMVYVGNNWFRWRPMRRVLDAIEPVRDQVGRAAVIGQGWDSPVPWGGPVLSEDAYFTDPGYLRGQNVEVIPPVRFDKVIDAMCKAMFSPVIYRPLFDHLQLVTCRTFETPAANTIPLFCQDAAYVGEIYGEDALELVLPDENPQEKILDMILRPEHYAKIVLGIRRRLAEKYSYTVQLQQLVEIVRS
jgi:hypothetical protein